MKTIFLMTMLLSVLGGCATKSSQWEKKVDLLLGEAVDHKQFSGALLVAKNDEILLSKGYGLANLEYMIPNTPQTAFRLGSLTKQFTAMAIMILKEQGKLSLDDSVVKYIPEYKRAKKVHLRHLLNHSSGIANFTGLEFYKEVMPLYNEKIDLIKRLYSLPLDYEPGALHSYSNSNYLILAEIIERASGDTYENYLEKNIFQPLKLKNTGIDHHQKIIPNRASGFMVINDQFVHSSFIDMSVPNGAGAMYSTVEDLFLWYRALRDNQLLSAEATRKMLTPSDKSEFAFGWVVSEAKHGTVVAHGGAINGFQSHIGFFPESDILVVVLTNIETPMASQVASKLNQMAFEKPYEPFHFYTEVPLNLERAPNYLGIYELAPHFKIEITLEDGQLFAQATGQGKNPLFQAREDHFFLKVVNAQVTFIYENGQITQLVLHQNGQNMPAKKIK